MKAGEYHYLYESARWRNLRDNQLEKQPLCEECSRFGRVTPATIAHHKEAHKGDPELFFDPDNLESTCKHCHDSHKQMEEIHGYTQACDEKGFPTHPGHPWRKQ